MSKEISTKEKILDVAEQLFYSIGYEETSMDAIQKGADIARGTLYYHFENKEKLLDRVIQRQGNLIFEQAELVSRDKNLSIEDRLIKSLLSMNMSSKQEEIPLDQVHHPNNALLHQKINQYIVERASPFLTEVVMDGINEGIFKTDYPQVAIEMILTYSNVAFDYTHELSQEQLFNKFTAFSYHIHRLLGAQQGILDFSVFIKEVQNE